MVCNECGDKPKKTCGAFPRSVIEIKNPETLVLLRKVIIPASLGDEDDVPPAVGKYHNVILQYEVNKHIYIYSSDGIPTAIEAANIPSDIVERIEALEGEMIAETSNREAADSELDARLTSAEGDISTLQAADTALRNAISEEVVARQNADSTLSGRIDAEATARQSADTALANSLSSEATTRANADTALGTQITGVSSDLATETTARQTADTGLQSQIDAITASSDVKDVVGTKAELNNYDTSTLGNNDIIKVLDDETQNDAVTYYRWNSSTQQFTLVGSEGPYYTKASTDTLLNAKADKATTYTKTETDNLLSGKQDTLTAGSNITITDNTISATSPSIQRTSTGTDRTDVSSLVLAGDNGTSLPYGYPTSTANGEQQWNYIRSDTFTNNITTAYIGGYIYDGNENWWSGKKEARLALFSDVPSVVQTTGDSTTSVMSQNAVTSMIFRDPTTKQKIAIGATNQYIPDNYSTSVGYGAVASTYGIAIGASDNVNSRTRAGTNGISIGKNARSTNYDVVIGQNSGSDDSGGYNVNVGYNAIARGDSSVAIGRTAKTEIHCDDAIAVGTNTLSSAGYAIAIGRGAKSSAANAIAMGQGSVASGVCSVALGRGASATAQGEMNIGVANIANSGYNNSYYRLLTGLYDPQSDHDAATKGYVDKAKPHYEGYLQEYTTTANTGTVTLQTITVSEDGVYLVTLNGWVNENGISHTGTIYPYVNIGDANTVYANTQTYLSDSTINVNEQQSLGATALISLSANDSILLQFGQSNAAAAGMLYKYSYGVIKLSN